MLLCSIVVKICPTGNRALFTRPNKISAASQTVATERIEPKICQQWADRAPESRFHPNRLTLGGVIAESVNAGLGATGN